MIRRIFLLVSGFLMGGGVFFWLCLHAGAQLDEEGGISLPCQIKGTPLVAVALESYTGVYLEDGGCELVQGIAALTVRNDGTSTADGGEVTLVQDGRCLRFSFSMLPPGETVLVLEQERQQYSGVSPSECTGWAAFRQYTRCPDLSIFLQREGIRVENTGILPTGQIKLYFKTYDPSRQRYMGGITYEVTLEALGPGEKRLLTPWYFRGDSSRIVGIQIQKQSA